MHLNQYVYDAAFLEYNNGIRELLSTAMHSHKWWSTLKTFLFGVNSSLPPIRTDDGSLKQNMPHLKRQKFFLLFFRINRVIKNSIFLQHAFPILN